MRGHGHEARPREVAHAEHLPDEGRAAALAVRFDRRNPHRRRERAGGGGARLGRSLDLRRRLERRRMRRRRRRVGGRGDRQGRREPDGEEELGRRRRGGQGRRGGLVIGDEREESGVEEVGEGVGVVTVLARRLGGDGHGGGERSSGGRVRRWEAWRKEEETRDKEGRSFFALSLSLSPGFF